MPLNHSSRNRQSDTLPLHQIQYGEAIRNPKSHRSTWVVVCSLVISLLAAAGVAWAIHVDKSNAGSAPPVTTAPTPTPTPTITPTLAPTPTKFSGRALYARSYFETSQLERDSVCERADCVSIHSSTTMVSIPSHSLQPQDLLIPVVQETDTDGDGVPDLPIPLIPNIFLPDPTSSPCSAYKVPEDDPRPLCYEIPPWYVPNPGDPTDDLVNANTMDEPISTVALTEDMPSGGLVKKATSTAIVPRHPDSVGGSRNIPTPVSFDQLPGVLTEADHKWANKACDDWASKSDMNKVYFDWHRDLAYHCRDRTLYAANPVDFILNDPYPGLDTLDWENKCDSRQDSVPAMPGTRFNCSTLRLERWDWPRNDFEPYNEPM